MRGDDIDLDDMLGPDPVGPEAENLVDEAPPLDRSGKAVLQRSRSYPMPIRSRKSTPERLGRILKYAMEMPIDADVCRRAEISITTLKYWLQKSFEGAPGDGFDIELGENDENGTEDNTIRFHDAYKAAFDVGVEAVEAIGHLRATGYQEPQVYRGRVQYKLDPKKLSDYIDLGLPVDDRDANLWLRDEAGAPVAETVTKIDPDLLMFILKARKPQLYGAKASVDVNVKGGVLVVGMRAATPEALNEIEGTYRREGRPAVTFEEGDDEGAAE
jgi:hypothetical protein